MLEAMIVGCGKIAGGQNQALTTHGGAYQVQKNVEVVACVDNDLDKSNAFAVLNHCEAERELQVALSKYQPDIVSICTPDSTHFQITENILTASNCPKIIFLEKPACQSATQLDRLIKLSDQKNVPIVVNHSRRFDQHHQQLRERISTGEFGDLISTNVTYYSGWQHNGVHMIDTLSYLLNDSIVVESVTEGWQNPHENDPTFDVQAVFKNKKSKINIMSFGEENYQIFEIDLRFSEARLRLEDFGERILLEKKYINCIGEKILQIADNGLTKKIITPMQKAVEVICQSIQTDNTSLLDGYLLQDISRTMQTIWQGQKMYEKN